MAGENPAFDALLQRANGGDATAQFELGLKYIKLAGVAVLAPAVGRPADDPNIALAFQWFTKAADQNHARAQINLGDMYAMGLGTKRDHAQAFQLFLKAATDGDVFGQIRLADAFSSGRRSVAKDQVKAVEWYTKAAQGGLAEAQHKLAIAYSTGDGVRRDYMRACEWFEAAALKGHKAAAYKLGELYASGTGVPKNDELAYAWFTVSKALGHVCAEEQASKIEQCLTKSQRDNGQAIAKRIFDQISAHK